MQTNQYKTNPLSIGNPEPFQSQSGNSPNSDTGHVPVSAKKNETIQYFDRRRENLGGFCRFTEIINPKSVGRSAIQRIRSAIPPDSRGVWTLFPKLQHISTEVL